MHTTLVKFSAVVAMVAGCGGGDPDNLFDEPIDVPDGPHHTYVVRALDMPTDSVEGHVLGLDIDRKANDGPDNQLGMVLGAVGQILPAISPQPLIDRGLAVGAPILLLSLRGPSLFSGPLELHTMAGGSPSPSPCRDELDETCGEHLLGNGSFAVAEPRAAIPITGLKEDGAYHGGAGDLVLPIVMGNRTTWLPLERGRAELWEVTGSRVLGKLGGAVPLEEINQLLIPPYSDAIRELFAADCTVGGALPDCGCVPQSAGAEVRGLFDKSPTEDCRITDDEVQTVASGLLTPDIDLDGDGVNESLSYGVGIEAVAGQFAP